MGISLEIHYIPYADYFLCISEGPKSKYEYVKIIKEALNCLLATLNVLPEYLHTQANILNSHHVTLTFQGCQLNNFTATTD